MLLRISEISLNFESNIFTYIWLLIVTRLNNRVDKINLFLTLRYFIVVTNVRHEDALSAHTLQITE